MEVVKEWAGIFMASGALLYTWLTSRASQNSDRLDVAEASLTAHEIELALLKEQLKQMPDKDMIHAQTLAMEKMNVSVAVMGEKLTTLSVTVRNMDRFWRESDSK